MSRIKNVVLKEDYRSELLLDNGRCVTFKVSDRLVTIRFGLLADKEFLSGSDHRWYSYI